MPLQSSPVPGCPVSDALGTQARSVGPPALKAPEMVADRIRKQIIAGTLKVGEFLPAEARLMEAFSVSRPTIREAFRILEVQRLISVVRGARGGALIHQPDPGLISAYFLMVLQAERTTVAEIYKTRRLLEPPLAREVATSGPDNAVARLQECLEHERATARDIAAFTAALVNFHRTIVELSGNRPLIHLMEASTSVLEKHQAMAMQIARRSQTTEQSMESLELAFRSQKKLIRLISERNGEAAEAHWFKHMDRAHKLYLNGFENLTIHELMAN